MWKSVIFVLCLACAVGVTQHFEQIKAPGDFERNLIKSQLVPAGILFLNDGTNKAIF